MCFGARNIDAKNSIPLQVAYQQIKEMRQLVSYSALSETNPKAFFINAQQTIAKRVTSSYRFGHTFRGSFGLSIETPRLSTVGFTTQKSLMPDLQTERKLVPIERRVMERIVRGLFQAKVASQERDPNILIENYMSGFNANMCRAILNMSMGKKIDLEYSIDWSAIFPPKEPELTIHEPIKMNEGIYDQLEYAFNVLSKMETEETEISGLIHSLSSKDNPLGLDTPRTILIKTFDDLDGKAYSILVTLNRDDYVIALDAHKNWFPVTVSGQLRKDKTPWRIENYTLFRVEMGFNENE
jgi:hypothetical protein